MKGLLIKDFYLIKKTCKLFIIMILGIFAAAVFFPERAAVYMYAVILMGMLSHSLLTIEERDGSDKYYLVCPVTKKQLVGEKYLLAAIFIAVILTAIAILEVVKKTDLSVIVTILSLSASVGMIFPSISMPIMFRFGYAKGKILLMCLGGLIGICSAFLVNTSYFFADTLSLVLSGFLPLILIVCTSVIYLLSYLLSVKLYKNREF